MNENEEIIDILREILKWTKITSIPKVKELLLEILTSPEEKIAYQSSDGKKTSREVAKQVNTGNATIARWWKQWMKAGIAEPVPVKGGGKRARRLFPLDDFGIEVPVIKATVAEEGNGGEEET